MKNCAGPCTGHEGGCNWLDGMVEDGRCPHCGGPVTDITTVTPLGRLMDEMSLGGEPGEDSSAAAMSYLADRVLRDRQN